LPLLDIQHNCAIVVVRAADCIENPVHRKTRLRAVAIGIAELHSVTPDPLKARRS
jgi:hypothetical protein